MYKPAKMHPKMHGIILLFLLNPLQGARYFFCETGHKIKKGYILREGVKKTETRSEGRVPATFLKFVLHTMSFRFVYRTAENHALTGSLDTDRFIIPYRNPD